MKLKIAAFLLALITAAQAQDRRKVTEPRVPSACVTLKSELAAPIAEGDESRLDTARIQKAIDGCPAGQGVVLEPGASNQSAFLSGPLRLKSQVALIIAKGATLYASRDPRLFDVKPGSCGIVNETGRGCKPLIAGDQVSGAGVMGDGVIDGRGAAKLLGSKDSWWDLAQQAKVSNKTQNCPRLIVITKSNDFTLYRITLKNSPNFHVTFNGDGFTAWGVIINTPKAGRNTDGIDPISATNVTITRCFIYAGDDNVAIKAGSTGPSTHMTIEHNHFYLGHGMSIGSETDGGASDILVRDLSIDGADNGLRIKSNVSRGGLVERIVYEDVCIRNTKNPIFMDSNYSFYGAKRDLPPAFRDITFRNVRVEGPGKLTLDGLDEGHRLGLNFDNLIVDAAQTKVTARHAKIQVGPGGVNFPIQGDDVTVSGATSGKASMSCRDKFVPMPIPPARD